MADSADSPSRLGLKLQDFDQVIAISQANINQSLKYTFLVDKGKYTKFDVSIRALGISMKGILAAPTVRLIDQDDADRAIFTVCFKSGTYRYMMYLPEDPLTEEIPQPKAMVRDITGWKLSFYVDFSIKKTSTIPLELRNKILQPDSYSVEQLMIDFGSTELSTFALEKSEFPGMEGQDIEEKSANNANIKQFADAYINKLRAGENAPRNVLGYAVTVKPPSGGQSNYETLKSISPDAPSFPPTKVRLQVINHRPNGAKDLSTIDNSYNAFLFTEMTGFRDMPKVDLAWSGDWFYNSIGGTMAMSRKIFWDEYLVKSLKVANSEIVQAANGIAQYLNLKQAPESIRWWLSDSEPAVGSSTYDFNSNTNGSKSSTFSWSQNKTTNYTKALTQSLDQTNAFKIVSTITNILTPIIGQGKVRLAHTIKLESNHNITVSGMGALANATLKTTVDVSWQTDLTFHAVDAGGLQVRYDATPLSITCTSDAQEGGILGDLGVLKAIREMCEIDTLKEGVRKAIAEVIRLNAVWQKVESQIENALSGQNRFIFPGGGTFEMKDPIFSNNGDLLIGLTYKSGESAS